MLALSRSLSNSVGLKSGVQALLQSKLDAYLEGKYRISRSHATRDSYNIIVCRFVNYIQIQYKQDFEQFLSSLKQPDTDPVGILDEYFTFLARGDKPLANNTIRFYVTVAKDFLNYLGCRIFIEDIKILFA